jgi:hypothetical protein
MHRPDTIIEIHRERVQDQTVEMFGGDKYAVRWSRQRDGRKVRPDVERTDSARLINVAVPGQRRARRNRPL